MTISVYDGNQANLQLGVLWPHPAKWGVPLVEDNFVSGAFHRQPAVKAYAMTEDGSPGWIWRAATQPEIDAAAGPGGPRPAPAPAAPQRPATNTSTVTAPFVTTATPPATTGKTDWAAILARAEQSGEMTDELRAQGLRLLANPSAAANPAAKSAKPATPIDTAAIYAKRANMDDVIAKLDQRM